MATIKSFTDLEQSKKLAEILSLDSADMKWYFWKSEIDAPKLPTFGYSKTAAESYKDTEAVYLACWSLSALLKTLNFPSLTQNKENEWEVCVFDHDNDDYIEKIASNPVDAAYKMIIKLKELNLL